MIARWQNPSTAMPSMPVDLPPNFQKKGRRGSVEIMAANMKRNMERQVGDRVS